jgi:KDO2-lipid IV(A) lauroyltransferase
MRNEARRSADLLWALGNRRAVLSATRVENREHIEAALSHGRGAILAGLHLGGWEIAASVAENAIPGRTTAVVADDWLAWAMDGRRRAVGLDTINRREAALGAARALRRGDTLLLLGDDGWGGASRSHRVRFLDGFASLPAGIVALARICRSPIVCFTFLPHGPRRWVGRFEPPIDPPAKDGGDAGEQRVLQLLADRWTDVIQSAPEQWAASFAMRWEAAP